MIGHYFYWFSWLLWILVRFFMKKTKQRTFLASTILITITLSNMYINIYGFKISLAFLFLLMLGFTMFTKVSKKYYHLFVAFTIMIGYSGMLFWINHTPLWLFIHELLLLPLLCCLLIFFTVKEFINRIMIGLVGITFGEVFYHVILSSYGMNFSIGSLSFFDKLLCTVVLLLMIELISKGFRHLYHLLTMYQQNLAFKKLNL